MKKLIFVLLIMCQGLYAQTLTPEMFGACGTDNLSDQLYIQQCFDEAVSSRGGKIEFMARSKYIIDSAIIIPTFYSGNMPQLTIVGNGAEIINNGIDYTIKKVTSDQNEADYNINSRVFIEGLSIYGTQYPSKGIMIQASYGSVIRNCNFSSLEVAVNLEFCLSALIEQNTYVGCFKYGNKVTHGSWPGSGTINSQSNQTILRQNRHFCYTGQLAADFVKDCSNIRIESPIYEGGAPINNVYASFVNGSVAKQFSVTFPHIENFPSNAVFYLEPNSGRYSFTEIWNQTASVLVHVANCSGNSNLEVGPIHYLSGWDNLFKQQAITSSNVSWMISVPFGVDVDENFLDNMFKQGTGLALPYYKNYKYFDGSRINKFESNAVLTNEFITNSLFFRNTPGSLDMDNSGHLYGNGFDLWLESGKGLDINSVQGSGRVLNIGKTNADLINIGKDDGDLVIKSNIYLGNNLVGSDSIRAGFVRVYNSNVRSNTIILTTATGNLYGSLRVSNIIEGISFEVRSNNPEDNGRFNYVLINKY